jgi:hypothetical protein
VKKISFLILTLVLSLNVFGQEKDVFQESLDKFEKYCFDQDDNLREDVFVKDEMYSCKSELEYLQHEFKRREALMSQHPEVLEQYKNCVEQRNNPKVSDFAEQGKELGEKVSCLEEEKKEFEKDCSKAMQCNVLRSILDGVDILPGPLERPVKNYIKKKASSKGYSKECMADDKSNCLEDFSNALIDNLWSSATSIFSLAKTGFKSLFNMTGFFDSQSDKALTAMNQSKEDVKSFMDSPGEWLVNFYDDLILGVDTWVRSSVFCQKWKYNDEIEKRGGQTDINSETFRTCIKPLESYACVDCDDKINATCVALGALTAELGVAFITAGVGTAANFAAKAGAKSLSLVAKKVSTKIKAVAPKLSKKSTPPTTKLGIAANAGLQALSKTTKMAITIASVSTEKALRVKAKMNAGILKIKNTKIVKVTSKAIEKGNIPGRISEHFGSKGALFGAKATSKLGKGAIKKEADVMLKASRRADRSSKAKEFVENRSHGKKRVYSHTSKSHKAYEKGEFAKSTRQNSKSQTRSKSGDNTKSKNQNELVSKNNSKKTERQNNEQKTSNEKQLRNEKLASDKRNNDQKLAADKKARDQKIAADKKAKDQKLAADKKARDEKLAADKKEKDKKLAQDKKDEEERKRKIKLGIAGVAADLSIKGINISNEQAEKEMRELKNHSNGKGEKLSKNLSSAKKILGVEGKSVFNNKTIEKIENLKKMYSDDNKETVVSNMRKSDPSISKSDAEKAFSNRQENVRNASDYIDRTRSVGRASNSSKSEKVKNLEKQLAHVKSQGEINSINSEINALKQQQKELKNNSKVTEENDSATNTDSIVSGDNSNVARNELSNNSSRTSSFGKPQSRSNNSSRSSVTSARGVGSVSSQVASFSSSEDSSNSTDAAIDSLDEDLYSSTGELAQIDGLHEAAEKIDPEVLEDSKDSDEEVSELERKDRKKSKNLKNLLGLLSKKKMKIEENVLIDVDLATIKATSSETQRKLDQLKSLSKVGTKAKKRITYELEEGRLEVYHFSEESYSLATSKSGVVEILSDDNSKLLIERPVGQVE